MELIAFLVMLFLVPALLLELYDIGAVLIMAALE